MDGWMDGRTDGWMNCLTSCCVFPSSGNKQSSDVDDSVDVNEVLESLGKESDKPSHSTNGSVVTEAGSEQKEFDEESDKPSHSTNGSVVTEAESEEKEFDEESQESDDGEETKERKEKHQQTGAQDTTVARKASQPDSKAEVPSNKVQERVDDLISSTPKLDTRYVLLLLVIRF